MTRVPGARIRLSTHCEPPNLVRIRAMGRLSPIRHQNLDEKRVNLGFWGWNGCLFIAYLLACAFSGLFSRLLHSLLLFLLSLFSLPSSTKPSLSSFFSKSKSQKIFIKSPRNHAQKERYHVGRTSSQPALNRHPFPHRRCLPMPGPNLWFRPG
ncbi:hypothetical protein CPAR01_08610 [Colletotrichum paranaense]|uniref:Uncharacterized protein n=1 Tax=Colletotrichum paranaense TaxID=1914294 RepID=A0ABQ9SM33_9PEZI|nr:uncharacterized protein CPAR01_08610 [Colletotrichum paranaense]KAK1538497.1 hypothetical protein CPAR01_08610 [Colletotrichum paranaense]